MGGFQYLTGDSDRPPVQVSFPQAFVTGSNEAAVGTMLALYHRDASGEGQHVDVSIQASCAKDMMNAPIFYETTGMSLRRAGPYRVGLSISSGQRVIWKCKDGEVSFFFWGGKTGARTNRPLTEYMDENGMAPDFMKEMDWDNFDMASATEELFEKLAYHLKKFFLTKTKKELFEEAQKRRMTLYPVQTVEDISKDQQLKERDFWYPLEHPELGMQLLYPKPPSILSEEFETKTQRAPLIGEHNEEIYKGDLGIGNDEMKTLKEQGVI
jgi:crotonobetainyl-CoA:carnitine CoA-transferase CaiB-like acyl-CoA transferase